MTAETTGAHPFPHYKRRSIDDVLRAKHAAPVRDIHELAVDGAFESDAEVEDFIAFYRSQRKLSIEG
ncbi:hypothetical protein ABIA35_000549 [Catenulispora sp. MAP12-49]